MSSYNDSDNVRTQCNANNEYNENVAKEIGVKMEKEIDVNEGNYIDVEGQMQSHSLDTLKQHDKHDPPTTDSVTATNTTRTSGLRDADSNESYTLPSGYLVDAKNSLRSYSVAAATADRNAIAAAALGRGEGVAAPEYKDQVRSGTATHGNQPSPKGRDLVPNVTLGDSQKLLMLTDSSDQNEGHVILPPTGPVNVHSERLPVYKDQANSKGDTDYNPNAAQGLVPDRHGQFTDRESTLGGGVSYKDTMYSTSMIPVAPSRRTLLDPSNDTSLTTEGQEHLLVATAVPDSMVTAARNDRNVVMAVPLTGRYWKVLAGMSLIVLVIGVIIGSVCATGNCSSSSPTAAPPSGSPPTLTVSPAVSRAEQVTSFINNITLTGRNITLTGRNITVSAVSNDTSLDPEELALHWLINYDTDLNLLPDTPISRFRLQQRYALAILWVQGDSSTAFFDSVGNECEWNGVTCQRVDLGDEIGIQQAVTTIVIHTNNNGIVWSCQLSADLGLLPTLIHFNMSSGYDAGTGGLFGTLLSQIGQLINLQTLDLSNNELTGSLPSQIGQMTNLQYFDMSYNRLTGTLPTQIGQLTNLTNLNVADNDMAGSLPSQIGQLIHLQNFDVSYNGPTGFTGTLAGNALIGSLPTQIGQMVNLQRFIVAHNALTGSLPTQIGRLTNLNVFDVSWNALTGSLPSQIGQLTNITDWLDVSSNKLVGSLPSQIGQLTNAQYLIVDTNALTGTIPTQIGQMTKLQYLTFYTNNLNGTMPEGVCLLRNHSLTILAADCFSEVSCSESCCTDCV
jgi:Leucine-rich repeat (LRR) protein